MAEDLAVAGVNGVEHEVLDDEHEERPVLPYLQWEQQHLVDLQVDMFEQCRLQKV